MVKTFKLEILASDHVFYSGECDELIFPGQDGSFGIFFFFKQKTAYEI